MLQHDPQGEGHLVAIDNTMTGIRHEYGGRANPQYNVYIGKVKE